MSNIIKNNRLSIYFRPRKDKDIISYIEESDICHGDICDFIKNLIRDGINSRSAKHTTNVMATHYDMISHSGGDNSHENIAKKMDKLLSVPVKKASMGENELEEMFDKL